MGVGLTNTDFRQTTVLYLVDKAFEELWYGARLDFAILCLALKQEVEFDSEDCGHHPSRQNVRQGQQTTYITHLPPGRAWPQPASR